MKRVNRNLWQLADINQRINISNSYLSLAYKVLTFNVGKPYNKTSKRINFIAGYKTAENIFRLVIFLKIYRSGHFFMAYEEKTDSWFIYSFIIAVCNLVDYFKKDIAISKPHF